MNKPISQVAAKKTMEKNKHQPLSGIRVIEFSHMVMGPSCGMVLGDLGADVIKIEPSPGGDNSRRLAGAGVGFFPAFNRNKRSVCVDIRKPAGLQFAYKLIEGADVVLENFRPGAMEKLGLGADQLLKKYPSLIYCACKGFLPGPYEHRVALDEVVQMMGGLAYMTGPPGQPIRAGASVNDIMGGVFAALAIVSALRTRDKTGEGGLVQSGLFETNMMFMAQHLARAAIDGHNPPSLNDPAGDRPWPVYDVFETSEPDAQVFVGAVTETQWRDFCKAFDFMDLLNDPALASSTDRVRGRPRILARIRPTFRAISKNALMARLDSLGLPFAPIAKPTDLLNDPHLIASGGLLQTSVKRVNPSAACEQVGLPALPIVFDGVRTTLSLQPPRVGEHTFEVARALGLNTEEISALTDDRVVP